MVSRRSIEQAVGIAVLALLAAACLLVLKLFLTAILWAVVLAFSTRPVYRRLVDALDGRASLAAALMVIGAACLVVLPVAGLGWSMADDVIRLIALVRSWFENGLPSPPSWVASIPLIGSWVATRWQELSQSGPQLSTDIAPYLTTIRSTLLTISAGFAGALLELVEALFIAFFLYRDGPFTGELLASIGERLAGQRAHRLIDVAGSTIRSVVVGVIGANLIQAVLGAFGFWLAGIPAAFLLGFVGFFLTMVPFGTVLIWVPACLWLLQSGHVLAAILLAAWCIVVYGILESVLRIYLIGRDSTLPMILILLGMLGGLSAFGLLGVFLGPTLLAIAYTLVEEWRVERPTVASE